MTWASDLVATYPLAFGLLSLSIFLAFVVVSFVVAAKDYDSEMLAASVKLDKETAEQLEPVQLSLW